MKIDLIISDFDGVIYNFDKNNLQDGLYITIKEKNPALHLKITSFLFREKKYIFNAWMRGFVNSRDLHILMANKFDTTVEFLDGELWESAKGFRLNWDYLNVLQMYRKLGYKVIIMTDNITPFRDILVPHFKLNDYFDGIYSSADSHICKLDEGNRWVKEIIEEYNCKAKNVLFIDDGEKLINELNAMNMNTFLYNEVSRGSFGKWMEKNIVK